MDKGRKSSDDEGIGRPPGGRSRKTRHNSWNSVNRKKMMAHIPKPPSMSPPKGSSSNPGIGAGGSDQSPHHSAVEVTNWKDDEQEGKKKKKTKTTPYKPDLPKPEALNLPINDLMKSFGIAKEKSARKTDDDDEEEGDKVRSVIKAMKKHPEKFDPVLQHSIDQTRKTSATLKEKLKQHLSDEKRDSGIPIPLALKKMDRRHKKKVEEEVKPAKKEEEVKEDSDSDPFDDDINLTRYHADGHTMKRRPYTEIQHLPHRDSLQEKEKRVAKRLSLEPKVDVTPAKDKTQLDKPRTHRSSKDDGTTDSGSPPKTLRRTGSGLLNVKKQAIERVVYKPDISEPKPPPPTQPTTKPIELKPKADLPTPIPVKGTPKQESQVTPGPVKAAPLKSDRPIPGKAVPPMDMPPVPVVVASSSPAPASVTSKPPTNDFDVKGTGKTGKEARKSVELPATFSAGTNAVAQKPITKVSPESTMTPDPAKPTEVKTADPKKEKPAPVTVLPISSPSQSTDYQQKGVRNLEPQSDPSVNVAAEISPMATTPSVSAAIAIPPAAVKEPPKQSPIYPERAKNIKPKQVPLPLILTTPKEPIKPKSTPPPQIDVPAPVIAPIPVNPSNQTSAAEPKVDQAEVTPKPVESQVGDSTPIIVKSGTLFVTNVPFVDSPRQISVPPIKPTAPKPAAAAASASTKEILAAKLQSLKTLPTPSKVADKSKGGKPPLAIPGIPHLSPPAAPIKGAPAEVEKTKLPPIPVAKPISKKADATVKARPTIRNLTAKPGPAPATKPKLSVALPTQEKKQSITPPTPVQEKKVGITPPPPVQGKKLSPTPPVVQEKKLSATPPVVQAKKLSFTPAAQESAKPEPPLQVIKAPAAPAGRASFGKSANEQGTMDRAPGAKLPTTMSKSQQEKSLEKGNVKFNAPIVEDGDKLITDEELGSVPLDHNSGLILAKKILAKPKPKKPNSVKKLGEKNEGELAQGVLKVFAQKVLEGGDLSRLQDFGIPEQRKLLNLMLHSDFGDCDFGGYMRECYSPILRGYCAMNMQERYRGGGKGAACFSALDLSKIGTVHQVKERDRLKKLADRDLHLEELRKVSIDDRHFKFLKELANNQPVSIPLTIIHELAVEILPMIKEMWEFYSKNLGANHECTVQAAKSFIRLLNRVIMYNAL